MQTPGAEVALEPVTPPNLLERLKDHIAGYRERKVTDFKDDLKASESKAKSYISGLGMIGIFGTGPLKLGTAVPLLVATEVLQTNTTVPGGLAAGFAAASTYGASVWGTTHLIKNGAEHFPRFFKVNDDTPEEAQVQLSDEANNTSRFLSNVSLGVKCNMISSPLMLAEVSKGRSKKELRKFSNRLSMAGAGVMFAASTVMAETVVISGHPELAQEIQDKLHKPLYLGSLTAALLALDGVNYLRKKGLNFMRPDSLSE